MAVVSVPFADAAEVFLGCVYLIGIVLLALMIAPLSSDWGLWTAMNPTAQFYLVASLPIFLLPFFVLFFMPSARRWRAKCREDGLVYKAAVKSGKLSLRKFQMVVAIIYLAATLGVLWCLWQAATSYRNQHGQSVVTATRV